MRLFLRLLLILTLPFSLEASGTLIGQIEGSAELGFTLGLEKPPPEPGVTITLTHLDHGRRRTQETDDAGRYLFKNLPLGDYTVEAHKDGFKVRPKEPARVAVSVDQTKVVVPPFRVFPIGTP